MEITINLKVTGLDRLAAAIESLTGLSTNAPQATPSAPATLSVVQPIQPVQQAQAAPIQAVQPVQMQPVQAVTPAAPVMQATQTAPMTQGATALATNPVPTVAPTYTADQLAVAATQLMDAGRQQDLISLLSAFGVQALTQLPKEMYGEFATRLRGMGAKI